MSLRLVLGLPLPLRTIGRLLDCIRSEWPDAAVVTDHDHGDGKLVVDLGSEE